VERGADGEHDDFARAARLDQLGGFFDCRGSAGDDGLVGGVEVGGGDGEAGLRGGFGAGFGYLGGGEREDGGHCTLARGDGELHGAAAGLDGADGVGKAEGAGGDVGRPLAEGVPGGESGVNSGLGEDARNGDADGEDGRLGVFGEAELFLWAVEEDAAEGEAEGFIGLGEGGGGDGEGLGEGAAHADGLGALAGKEEGDLSVVHINLGF